MSVRQRLLALLEVYDTAIEELYVLGDPGFVDLILRLERRRRDAANRLAEVEHAREDGVSSWLAEEIASAHASRPPAERRSTGIEGLPVDVSKAGAAVRAAR